MLSSLPSATKILTNRFGFWLLVTAALVCIFCLGSWYPFSERPASLSGAWEQWWASRNSKPPRSDLGVNLLLGLPLGFSLGMLLLPFSERLNRPMHKLMACLLIGLATIVCIGSYSLVIELGQAWSSSRVTSIFDSAMHLIGGGLGFLLAFAFGDWCWRRWLDIWTTGQSDNALRGVLCLYAFGYCLWMLMPFVPTVSPSELKAKWKGGLIQLSPFYEWSIDPWQAAYTAGISAALAFPIGLLFATSQFPRARSLRWMLAVAVAAGFELAQVFIETRVASMADCAWSVVGVTLGFAVQGYWANESRGRSLQHAGKMRFALSLFAILYMAFYLVLAWAPFQWKGMDFARERWWAVWQSLAGPPLAGDDLLGASNLFRTLVLSVILGALPVVAASGRAGASRLAVVVVFLCQLVVCTAAEGGQLFLPTHSPSLVDLLVRYLGCLLGGYAAILLRGVAR